MSRPPSLNALRVFHAAALSRNFLKAAAEIGVTQGAVSRQIQALEETLGTALFDRSPRGVSLTEQGDALLEYTIRIFSDVDELAARIGRPRSRQILRVAVARSYSTRILAHRLSDFCNQHPWIDLYLDGHRHLADLEKSEADAAIRVGVGPWPDLVVDTLWKGRLVPVAAPDYLAGRTFSQVLVREPSSLILLDNYDFRYWSRWLKAKQPELTAKPRMLHFSETNTMLEAAEAGQGVAMARECLVQRELKTGRLITVSRRTIDDDNGYYFVVTARQRQRRAVKAFRDWVVSISRS